MYEFSTEYERWFTDQARRLSGGSVQPRPPTPIEASFPVGGHKLMQLSSHPNLAGRFASLASVALLGRTICDEAICISLRNPWVSPFWMSQSRQRDYLKERFWDDLAGSIFDGMRSFYSALECVHAEPVEEAIGHDLSCELDARLAKELDPFLKLVRKMLVDDYGFHLSDFAFKELFSQGLVRLFAVRQAYCMATRHERSYAVVPLTEQLVHGLVISVGSHGANGSTTAVVLTA